MTDRTAKIAVIGAGSVGATIAYAAMIRGIARQIVLYDLNRAKVTAEVLDLNHGLQFVPMAKIEGSDDIAICARRRRRRHHRWCKAETGADADGPRRRECRYLQNAPSAVAEGRPQRRLLAGDQSGRCDHLYRSEDQWIAAASACSAVERCWTVRGSDS